MKDNQALKETYNRIAKDWNNDHTGDKWWLEGVDAFLSLLPKGSSILDVGCGGGYKTNYMIEKGFKAEGIDFSEGMIRDAKTKFTNINFEVFDIYDFDQYTKKFDAIFCQAVLLHIPRKKIVEVLKKMKSKINDGGLLYIAVKEKKLNGVEEEIKKENDYGYEYERFFSYYTLYELRKYFKDVGIEIIYEKIINSGRSNWINLIGRK